MEDVSLYLLHRELEIALERKMGCQIHDQLKNQYRKLIVLKKPSESDTKSFRIN